MSLVALQAKSLLCLMNSKWRLCSHQLCVEGQSLSSLLQYSFCPFEQLTKYCEKHDFLKSRWRWELANQFSQGLGAALAVSDWLMQALQALRFQGAQGFLALAGVLCTSQRS